MDPDRVELVSTQDLWNLLLILKRFTFLFCPWRVPLISTKCSEYMVVSGTTGSLGQTSRLHLREPVDCAANLFNSFFTVPSAAPGNVSAVAVSSTQILLTWASVPEQDQNGLILGYKVHVKVNVQVPPCVTPKPDFLFPYGSAAPACFLVSP